jgi:predicted Zn-ribbon and HTH transcriptional regulator
MTSRHRFIAVVLFGAVLLLASGTLWAQDDGLRSFALDDIPEEYERSIRDLVERYEEARTLLREQIRRNSELYTRQELDNAVADLEDEMARLEEENEDLRREYKTMLVTAKNYRDDAYTFKNDAIKKESGLNREIATLEGTLDSIEEENLFQLGATFSPAGRIGAIGLLNLPGTTVSLVTEGIYDLRDKEFTTAFGVAFGFLPQRAIVEGYQRVRNRRSAEAE